ncbi:MAG TPA: hypothetical protein VF191_03870 [Cyclobacteriaceae bacterium]
MNSSKFVIATLAGGITYFILGFLVYAVALEGFYSAHAGSATGVAKTDMQFWPLILGNLSYAALLAYIYLKWAGIKTFGAGFSAGATIGFLVGLGINMIAYDTSNIQDLTASIVDVFVWAIMTGIAGGIVGWVLGK